MTEYRGSLVVVAVVAVTVSMGAVTFADADSRDGFERSSLSEWTVEDCDYGASGITTEQAYRGERSIVLDSATTGGGGCFAHRRIDGDLGSTGGRLGGYVYDGGTSVDAGNVLFANTAGFDGPREDGIEVQFENGLQTEVRTFNGSGGLIEEELLPTVQSGVWYRITFVVYPHNETVVVEVRNTETGTTLGETSLRTSGATQLEYVNLRGGGYVDSDEQFFDDVSIEAEPLSPTSGPTAEPATPTPTAETGRSATASDVPTESETASDVPTPSATESDVATRSATATRSTRLASPNVTTVRGERGRDGMGIVPLVAGVLGLGGVGGVGAWWVVRHRDDGDGEGTASGDSAGDGPAHSPPGGGSETGETRSNRPEPADDDAAEASRAGASSPVPPSGTGSPRQVYQTALGKGSAASSRGDQRADDGEYEAAREAYAEARDAYVTALTVAEEYDDVDDATPAREGLSDAEDAIEETRKAEIEADLDPLARRIETAEARVDDEEFEAAIETLESLDGRLQSLAGRAAEHGFDDLSAEAQTLDETREALLATATERLRTRERRAELRAELSDHRERVEAAEAALANDAYDDAVETALSVGDALDELSTRVDERELEGLAADVEDLRDRAAECESTARAERPGPPAATPTEPDLALTHDALEVAEPIGKGGNADVYRATVDRDGRTYELALKEPRLSGTVDTDVMDQFIEEARTWERLDDHDHVVGIVDYSSDPLPWIAMEYMDRGDLRDRIAEVDTREALWIATSVTDAVVHAHQRGISHLDLKPANVLFRSADDWPVPKVADWGLARMILEHSQTIEGLTPHYAAPEQLDEAYGSVDHATDVYQLGATFYELFVGQPPHTGEPVRVVRKTLDDPVTPPSELADVPPELDDILLRALARDKSDRYDYLLHMHDDLASLLDEE